ncbi:hypothetical protein AU152_gp78 [Mycobacterium phage Phlei]|uniref:Uncharacterized protein n=1 Tax=Mycobacterium phage Phlei TaxID=1690684 RepID=A0A0N9BDP1_9CAUD|nr:hypothetical protein AU152_gp78 [Mycobacterium phage Phlei]ALA48191.1 hypothetical protein [Mycobacterium phage Phlei]
MTALKKVLDIAGAEFDYDKWNVAMSLFFDIADVLDASDIEGDVTPEVFARWQYHRAPFRAVPSLETIASRAEDFIEGEWADDYSYATVALASALLIGEITQQDLVYVGDVLSRYTSLLGKAGLSYC